MVHKMLTACQKVLRFLEIQGRGRDSTLPRSPREERVSTNNLSQVKKPKGVRFPRPQISPVSILQEREGQQDIHSIGWRACLLAAWWSSRLFRQWLPGGSTNPQITSGCLIACWLQVWPCGSLWKLSPGRYLPPLSLPARRRQLSCPPTPCLQPFPVTLCSLDTEIQIWGLWALP